MVLFSRGGKGKKKKDDIGRKRGNEEGERRLFFVSTGILILDAKRRVYIFSLVSSSSSTFLAGVSGSCMALLIFQQQHVVHT